MGVTTMAISNLRYAVLLDNCIPLAQTFYGTQPDPYSHVRSGPKLTGDDDVHVHIRRPLEI